MQRAIKYYASKYLKRAGWTTTHDQDIISLTKEEVAAEAAAQQSKIRQWHHLLCRWVPGIVVFGVLFMTSFFAAFQPRAFFICATIFAAYNFFTLLYVGFFGLKGLKMWNKSEDTDFKAEYQRIRDIRLKSPNNYNSTQDAVSVPINDITEIKVVNWDDVVHYVVFPNYKESPDILSESLNTVAKSSNQIAKTHVVIVLAMEQREETAADKASELISKHQHQFKRMMYTLHPSNIPGETPGKQSNNRWALQEINKDVQERGIDKNNVCVTIADADSLLHSKYFEALTSKFCIDMNRYEKIWQSPMVWYQNWFSAPVMSRITTMGTALNELSSLADDQLDVHLSTSTYTASLNYLNHVNPYDDLDAISEDWHTFLKGFFTTKGRARVDSIMLPTLGYTVEGNSYMESLSARFTQAKRHALGVSEVVYFLRELAGTKGLSIFQSLRVLWKIASTHIILGGMAIYFLTVPMLVLKYYELNNSPLLPLLYQWSWVFRAINMANLIPLTLTLYVHCTIVKRIFGNEVKWWHNIRWVVDFVVFGYLSGIFFVTIPALIACLKVMYTESFVYIPAVKPTINSGQNKKDDV